MSNEDTHKHKIIEYKLDYCFFAYALEGTKIKDLDSARKDFKFLKEQDRDKKFYYTFTFVRSIAEDINYTSGLSLFENVHDVLAFDRLDTRIFKFIQEKQAFEFYHKMNELFMPAHQRAVFCYKGEARPQIEIDKLIIAWSQDVKKINKNE